MKGAAVIDGIRLPVTDVRLRGGRMVFWCTVAGPVRAVDGVFAVTVFGEDGTGICQGDCAVRWCDVGPEESLAFRIGLRMDECWGDAGDAKEK